MRVEQGPRAEASSGGAEPVLTAPSLPQIGVWYSNRTLAMNATTLDINLSQTLANKTLVVTTILVSGARRGGPWMQRPLLSGAPAWS